MFQLQRRGLGVDGVVNVELKRMHTDEKSINAICVILLTYLFSVGLCVIVYPENACLFLMFLLFVVAWILAPIVIYNIEKFPLWFWVLSAVGWILFPFVVYIWLPDLGHEATTISWYEEEENELRTLSRFAHVVISSISGALISLFSIFVATRIVQKRRMEKEG